jgi:arabinogalactan endo-1,4-beta-galactosidase
LTQHVGQRRWLAVQGYTRDVIAAFAKQGTPVDMASIGNEIRNGMLWPVGQLDWTADTGWDNLATLLKAGVAGARAANPPHHQLRVMLRFDQGGSNADSTRFFGNLISRGVDFDVIGLSYYTFWQGR